MRIKVSIKKVDFTEGEKAIETPYEDIADIDPKWEKWAERKLKDAEWRNEATVAYKRLIEATKNFNRAFQGQVRPREMEPHWESVLQKIEAIEAEIKSQGFVRNFSIFIEKAWPELKWKYFGTNLLLALISVFYY